MSLARRAASCSQHVVPRQARSSFRGSGAFSSRQAVPGPLPRGPRRLQCQASSQKPVETISESSPPSADGSQPRTLELQKEPDPAPVESSLEYASSPLAQVTVRELIEDARDAVGNASLGTIGSVAAASGGAALALAVAAQVLHSLHQLPLLPQAMQTVGIVYCGLVAREHWTQERVKLAPSPLGTLQGILGTARKTYLPASEIMSRLPQNVDERVGARLKAIVEERDQALAQLAILRKQESDVARAVAEKEALEAVALRLAGERDNALEEVTALRTAVNAMTERMKAIEAMLAQEVQRLQEQNRALETVALQLADERDRAVAQVSELQGAFDKQREEDKRVLEVLASQLIEERNSAVKELQELRLVVSSLTHAQGADSGLPPEMEAFIKSRVQAVRAQFVDVSKPYASQVEAVDSFVSHLVEEFGAPRDWTRGYIQEVLEGGLNTQN